MTILQATILGIVQGITEFLPISSSGHLVLIPELFGWEQQPTSFDITIHAATLCAIIIFFRRDLLDIIKKLLGGDNKLALNIIITTIPAGLIGFFFNDFIESQFKSIGIIVFMLISIGIVMIFIEKITKRSKDIENLSSKESLFIGLAQALALIRGTSRSGSAIIGGLLTGLSREEAARYAFIVGVPIMLAVSLKQLIDFSGQGTGDLSITVLAVGFVCAFISGIIAIKALLAVLQKRGLAIFGLYRIGLGILILLFVA